MVLTGRGGFGNYLATKANVPEPAVSYTPVQHIAKPNQKIRTGRGGFGNTVKAADMEPVTPDEYLHQVSSRREQSPPNYMIGRGGVGNFFGPRAQRSGSVVSTSSTGSFGGAISPNATAPNEDLQPFRSRLWAKVRPSKTR